MDSIIVSRVVLIPILVSEIPKYRLTLLVKYEPKSSQLKEPKT